ncbi:MAG: hypothetical protein CVV36_06150 [Candidatus Methanoperedenaceae archaeon HGW-Methanoperedenaceae-1]|jgi:SAM-dependent methyltransferase|nr:MAG: hypothetical protein CVV36_06150 [Candidatus Methanoperedenaceae archaeon HGW-Methanoperedenaceae-1]
MSYLVSKVIRTWKTETHLYFYISIEIMDKIARAVNQLYEKYPYPYLPVKSENDLIGKLHHNVMANILETAGLEITSLSGKTILDAGCGTGEKACYYSYHGANVSAIDLSSASLLRARELADKFNLAVDFKQCDIADFTPFNQFDHIFCLGVLHHTSDPYTRFGKLAGMCKPGGTITVGLYNTYGRLWHRLRRMKIRKKAGNNIEKRMDYVERAIFGRKFKSAHEKAFAADKYANPYESYHSVGEVLGWFDKNDISFTGAYPQTGKGKIGALITQLKWLSARKGFFIVSGKKNP